MMLEGAALKDVLFFRYCGSFVGRKPGLGAQFFSFDASLPSHWGNKKSAKYAQRAAGKTIGTKALNLERQRRSSFTGG